jgi:hypothetical protein
VEKSLDSRPVFKKATLAIDRIMAKRKSAVIKSDKGSKKK